MWKRRLVEIETRLVQQRNKSIEWTFQEGLKQASDADLKLLISFFEKAGRIEEATPEECEAAERLCRALNQVELKVTDDRS